MDKKTEYDTLRAEILSALQAIRNYRTILYTIVIAALAFAFEKEEAILFLIPFCAIIPLYLLAMHQIDSVMRMGAYIYVFLEPGTECQWETRLYQYDRLHRNQYSTKKTSIDVYWAMSLCCLFLSIVKLDYCNKGFDFYFTIILQIVIFITCTYMFIKKRPDYLSVKEHYIDEWEEIKCKEK